LLRLELLGRDDVPQFSRWPVATLRRLFIGKAPLRGRSATRASASLLNPGSSPAVDARSIAVFNSSFDSISLAS